MHPLLRRMRRNLMTSSPSVAMTVLIAAWAWFVSHASERIATAPTVEFGFTSLMCPSTVAGGQTCTRLSLENLSRQMFSKATFEIRGSSDRSVTRVLNFQTDAPATPPKVQPTAINGTVVLSIEQFQPRARYVLDLSHEADVPPTLVLTSAASAIEVGPPSLETFFARNETLLIAIGMTILTVFLSAVALGNFWIPSVVAGAVWLLGIVLF